MGYDFECYGCYGPFIFFDIEVTKVDSVMEDLTATFGMINVDDQHGSMQVEVMGASALIPMPGTSAFGYNDDISMDIEI